MVASAPATAAANASISATRACARFSLCTDCSARSASRRANTASQAARKRCHSFCSSLRGSRSWPASFAPALLQALGLGHAARSSGETRSASAAPISCSRRWISERGLLPGAGRPRPPRCRSACAIHFVAKARGAPRMPVLYHLVALDLDGRIIGAFPVDGRDKGLPLRAERLLLPSAPARAEPLPRRAARRPARRLSRAQHRSAPNRAAPAKPGYPAPSTPRAVRAPRGPGSRRRGFRKKLFGGRDQVLAFLLRAHLAQPLTRSGAVWACCSRAARSHA